MIGGYKIVEFVLFAIIRQLTISSLKKLASIFYRNIRMAAANLSCEAENA